MVHDDGHTSDFRRWAQGYSSPLCNFAENVLDRTSKKHPNTEPAWSQGLWLGRCPVNNEVLVATFTGEVVRARTIKRLPLDQQVNNLLLDKLVDTPLKPNGKNPDDPTFLLPREALAQFQFAANQLDSTQTTGKRRRTEASTTDNSAAPDSQQPTTTDEPEEDKLLRELNFRGPLPAETADGHTGTSSSSTAAATATGPTDMDIDSTAPPNSTKRTADDNSTDFKPRKRTYLGSVVSYAINLVNSLELVGSTRKFDDEDVLLNEDSDNFTWHDDDNFYFDHEENPLDPTLVSTGIESEKPLHSTLSLSTNLFHLNKPLAR